MEAMQEVLWADEYAEAIMGTEDNLVFMQSLEDEAMKLIVTSPPYNIGKSYEDRRPLEKYVGDYIG